MDLNTWLTPTALVVLITLVTLFAKFATWRANVNTDRSTFKEFMEEVKEDIKDIKSSIAGLKGDVDGLKSDVDGLKSNVDGLESNVGVLNSSVAILVSKKVDESQSPTRLNNLGKSISKEIQGKEWAKDVTAQNIEQHRGKQPYDIQKFAFTHAFSFDYSKGMTEQMKQSAWENCVPIEIIIRVLSFELRDALLDLLEMDPPEDHPGNIQVS